MNTFSVSPSGGNPSTFAWSHPHLCAKRGSDPFEVPLWAAHTHPADAARMTAPLKALARNGFTDEAGHMRDPLERVRSGALLPDSLLDKICD